MNRVIIQCCMNSKIAHFHFVLFTINLILEFTSYIRRTVTLVCYRRHLTHGKSSPVLAIFTYRYDGNKMLCSAACMIVYDFCF